MMDTTASTPSSSHANSREILAQAKRVYPVGEKTFSLRRALVYFLIGSLAVNNISFIRDGADTAFVHASALGRALKYAVTGSTPPEAFVAGDRPAWVEQGQEVLDDNLLAEVSARNGSLAWDSIPKDPFTSYFASHFKGGLDTSGAVAFFVDRQVSPQDALIIVCQMQIAQGVAVLGKNDKHIVKREQKRQQDASSFLWQAWEALQKHDKRTFSDLVKKASTEPHVQLAIKNTGNNAFSKPNEHLPLQGDMDYTGVEVQIAQSFLLTRNTMTQEDGVFVVSAQWEEDNLLEARGDLVNATREAGIAVLHVPSEVAYDTVKLRKLAANIRGVNKDLQQFTGLTGGVLGMNYRLVLDLDTLGGDAYTYPDKEGFIHIKAWWDTLGHEWFHLLDFSQNDYVKLLGVGQNPSSTLSSQNNPNYGEWSAWGDPYHLTSYQALLWKGLKNPPMTEMERMEARNETRSNLLARRQYNPGQEAETTEFLMQPEIKAASEVVEHGSPWLHWRSKARSLYKQSSPRHYLFTSFTETYLSSPDEVLAFSFAGALEGYYEDQYNKGSSYRSVVLSNDEEQRHRLAAVRPTLVESRAVAPLWRGYFSNLQAWWKHDQHQRKAEDIPSAPSTLSFTKIMATRDRLEQRQKTNEGRATTKAKLQ